LIKLSEENEGSILKAINTKMVELDTEAGRISASPEADAEVAGNLGA